MRLTEHMDLHMHSYYSLDGEFSPAKLMELCAQEGLRTVSLTDHNCVRGVEEATAAGKEYGIQVIPGVELDCVQDGTDLHLLGYEIDSTDRRFRENEKKILEQKRSISGRQMEMLHEMGFTFDNGAVMGLAKDGVVTGEMIAEAALADVRNEGCPLLAPYRRGGARGDNPYVNFFWDYCAQGRPAFLPVQYMSFEEAVELIMDTGGTAVIAHPAITVKRDENMITYMAERGVRGLEVFSSYHTEADVEYYKRLAQKLGLMQTTGSDFHGKTKPSVFLGKAMKVVNIDKKSSSVSTICDKLTEKF